MSDTIEEQPARPASGLARVASSAVYPLLTALIVGAYAAYTALFTMPVTEGWYTLYAKAMNEGRVPYKDFELLFTPLYPYAIAWITRMFGYDIYVLRIVGIFVFVALAVLMYYIYERVFGRFVALVAAITSAAFLQSEIVFIAYDYIRWYDLFTLAAVLTLLTAWSALAADERRGAYAYIALSGLFSGLGILTRQNSGLIYFTFTVLALVFVLFFVGDRKRVVYGLMAAYVAATALPAVVQVIQLVQSNSLRYFLGSTTSGAVAAKGGMVAILFSWIGRAVPLVFMNRWEVFALLLSMFTAYWFVRPSADDTRPVKMSERTLAPAFAGAVVVGVLLLLRSMRLSFFVSTNASNSNTPYVLYFIVLLSFAVSIFLLVTNRAGRTERDREWLIGFILLQGAVLAIGYGAGTSGGLSQGETVLAVGVVFGLLFKVTEGKYRGALTAAVVVLACFSVYTYVALKTITPYSWWGLTEMPLRKMDRTAAVPYLDHLRLSKKSSDMYENAHALLSEHLGPSDQMFVFPHVPIFYLMQDKMPFTRSYVQWFDVVSDQTVKEDMQRIRDTAPQAIVLCEVPKGVMNAHESAFRKGRKSGLRRMQDFLKTYTQQNSYLRVRTYSLDFGYPLSILVRAAFVPPGDPVEYVPLKSEARVVSQTVRFKESTIGRMYVDVATFRLKAGVRMRARLVDVKSGDVVLDTTVDSKDFENREYHEIAFPETRVDPTRTYRVDLSAEGAGKRNALLVFRTEGKTATPDLYAVVDGIKQDYNLCVAFTR